jgi:hypothetical protein
MPDRPDRTGRSGYRAECGGSTFTSVWMDRTHPGLIVAMPDELGESRFWTVAPFGTLGVF